MDAEAAAKAITDQARAARKRPSRRLWLAAIVVGVLSVSGLAYGLVTSWSADPEQTSIPRERVTHSSGFTLGLVIGIGAGIAIGSFLALRKRS